MAKAAALLAQGLFRSTCYSRIRSEPSRSCARTRGWNSQSFRSTCYA